VGAGGIQRRRVAGGAEANDDDVVNLGHRLSQLLVARDLPPRAADRSLICYSTPFARVARAPQTPPGPLESREWATLADAPASRYTRAPRAPRPSMRPGEMPDESSRDPRARRARSAALRGRAGALSRPRRSAGPR